MSYISLAPATMIQFDATYLALDYKIVAEPGDIQLDDNCCHSLILQQFSDYIFLSQSRGKDKRGL